MGKLLILGAGVMGSAFAVPAADNGHQVTLVGTASDGAIIAALAADRAAHPRLGAALPESITPVAIEALSREHLHDVDFVILGVSSPGIGWAIDKLREVLAAPKPVALLTKGLQGSDDSLRSFPSQIAEALADLGIQRNMIMGIGGPCIAKELADRQPTAVVFAGEDRSHLEALRGLTQTAYYRVALNEDLEGVEFCAAMKNLLAIAVSAMWTRHQERNPQPHKPRAMNPAAAVFTQAVREMAGLNAWFGGRPETPFGLAGMGDLNVTVGGGRNSRLGFLLGEGMSLEAALSGPLAGETVEGADTALALAGPLERAFAGNRLAAGDFPVTRALLACIRDGEKLAIDFETVAFV